MKKFTLDILDAYNEYQNIMPEKVRHNEYTSNFFLDNKSWDKHFDELKLTTFTWSEFKYSDVTNGVVRIDTVVPDKIGVYMFIVKPKNTIYDIPKYVYYVGIAGVSSGSGTLRKRLKNYFQGSQLKKRTTIGILIHKFYENLYIAFSPVTVNINQTLENIETNLIGFFGTHLLANKDDIPIDLKPQAKAFNM